MLFLVIVRADPFLDLPGYVLAAPIAALCGWKGVVLSLSLSQQPYRAETVLDAFVGGIKAQLERLVNPSSSSTSSST